MRRISSKRTDCVMIELSQKELAYIVAAVGRVTFPLNPNFWESLYDQLNTEGSTRYHEISDKMEFSNRG